MRAAISSSPAGWQQNPPAGRLHPATWGAARALGLDDDLGIIQPGYLADLVLLSANLLENIKQTPHIEAVVLNGQWLARESLDVVITEVESLVEEQRRTRGTTEIQ